ncbi:FG-GAP repeat protein [Leptospira kmetyi serovar Malaysia str. Bejo-Iso9]|nr:FG-GAP repeat protein [Leptospira kmetyi serovar Malaysia str. Bejo-Iso9]
MKQKRPFLFGIVFFISFSLCCDRIRSFNPGDMSSSPYYESVILQCMIGQTSGCIPPSIRNVLNSGVLHSGFLTGDLAPFASGAEVSLDGAPFQPAIVTGTTWKFALPTGSQIWKQNSKHSVVVRSSLFGACYGIYVRKGNNQDVNGDGFPDLIVGANQYAGGDGKVYIFHGGSQGISSQSALSANTSLASLSPGSQFGWFSTLGDINGDGYADAIVSAPNTGTDAVYIFHSSGSSGILNGASPTSTLTAGSTVFFGGSIATGDVNGDGFEDLVIGSYGYSTSQGRVDIFHSSGPNGISTASIASAQTALLGAAINNRFGISVAAGDVNGDGYSDVLVGADGASRSYVFHSSGSSGITSQNLGVSGISNTLLIGESASLFGISVALGDINGDGLEDALIGGRSYSANQGRAYAFHSSGNSGIANQDLSTSGIANTYLTGQAGTGFFGISVALGDVNGDGFHDALVGAYGLAQGNGFVFLSSGNSGIVGQNLSAGGTAHAVFSGENSGDQFGIFVAFGDGNGDGLSDACIGAYGYSTNQGRAYLFAGTHAGVPTTSAVSATTILTGEVNSQFAYSIASYVETTYFLKRFSGKEFELFY